MSNNRPPNFADPRNVIDMGRKDSLATWMAFYGMLEDTTDRYTTRSDWAKAPADEAFIHAAIRLRALSAASVPLRVYVRSGHDLTPADLTEDKDAKELQELLDFVNPDTMSSSDLKATLVSSLSIYGEAYLLKTRGRLGGRPKELHFLNPAAVTPKMGDRWIDEYVYQPVGRQQTATYDPKDVIAFRVPGNFIDPTRGLSPINAVRMEIGTSRMATEHTNSQLRNQGVPAGVWVAPKDSEITTQDQSTIKRVLASLRGPKNAGKTAVLPGGLEWRSLGFSEKDAQYLMARKVSRMAIGAALGVPLALLGDDEHTGVYRSTRDAEQVFWRRLTEELNWMAQIIDSWLTSEYDKTGQRLTVRFDTSAVEALRPTIMEQSSLWQMMLSMGIVTTNEARAHFGVGAPVEWGNVPVRSGGLAPIGVDGMPVMPAAPAAPGAPAPDAAQPAEGKEPAVIDAMTPEDESDDPEVQPLTPTVSSWQRFGGSSQSGLPKGSKHADHDQADHGNRDGAGGGSDGDDKPSRGYIRDEKKEEQASWYLKRDVTDEDREAAELSGQDIDEWALNKSFDESAAKLRKEREAEKQSKDQERASLRETRPRIALDKSTPVPGGVAKIPITRAQADALATTLWGQGEGSTFGYTEELEKSTREAVEAAINNPRGGLVLPSYHAAQLIANSLASVGQARSNDGGGGAARRYLNLAEKIVGAMKDDPFAEVSGSHLTTWVFDPFDQPSGDGWSISQLDTPAKFLAIKHGDHDQADHGNRDGAGSDEIQVDTAQFLSPAAAAADLARRLGDSPTVEARPDLPPILPTNPPEWSSWKPREGGLRVTLTSAQKDLITMRGMEQSDKPRTWNHVMAQIVEGRRGLDLDGDDVKELLDMVRNEADVHLDRRMAGFPATAGEQRVVASLIAKLESITGAKFLAIKHADHDQSDHGNRDGAGGGSDPVTPEERSEASAARRPTTRRGVTPEALSAVEKYAHGKTDSDKWTAREWNEGLRSGKIKLGSDKEIDALAKLANENVILEETTFYRGSFALVDPDAVEEIYDDPSTLRIPGVSNNGQTTQAGFTSLSQAEWMAREFARGKFDDQQEIEDSGKVMVGILWQVTAPAGARGVSLKEMSGAFGLESETILPPGTQIDWNDVQYEGDETGGTVIVYGEIVVNDPVKFYVAIKHGDHDQSSHGDRDGAGGGSDNALANYTQDSFKVNEGLRSGTLKDNPVGHLFKPGGKETVFRTISGPAAEKVLSQLKDSGKTSDKGNASTSLDPVVAQDMDAMGDGLLLKILVPEGAPRIQVPAGTYDMDQQEIILPPGSVMTLVGDPFVGPDGRWTAEVELTDWPDSAPAKAVLPAGLYRQPAVKAYLAGQPLDSTALVGRVLSAKAHQALELGLRRRYNATQIAEGVPTEGFVGLEGVRDDRA